MRGRKELCRFAVAAFVLTFLAMGSARADLAATLIDHADSTASSGSAYYTPVSISVQINPAITNWIAWHDLTSPTIVDGAPYVGDYAWIAVNDYFDLTIKNPNGSTARVRMDYNNALADSYGPQAVIYGDAALAPDVARWGAYWSPQSAGRVNNKKIFDEAGAFNSTSIFTTSGIYDFTFAWGNTGGYEADHPEMYLLVDTAAVPVPGAALLGVLGLGYAGTRLRRRKAS